MRIILVLSLLNVVAIGQHLSVKSATARAVALEWDGADVAATVERTSGNTTQKIATVNGNTYEDTKVDRFETYRYRVSVAGKTSNQVIVGPPPTGVLNASPLPKGIDPAKYGPASAIALDENGDPMIVFEWLDPNGDNEYSDNEIRFVRWSRAAYKWLPSVRMRVVGEIPTQSLNSLSIGCDRKTGLLAAATPVQEKGAVVLISKDGGASWTDTPIPGVAGTVHSTAIAVANDTIYLALNSEDSGLHYISGPVQDARSWRNESLAAGSGWKADSGVNVALVMDRSDRPAVAWIETPVEGEGRRFIVWQPGGSATPAVQAKKGADGPSLALTAGGGKLGLLVGAPLDDDTDHAVWFSSSSDGVSWSKPSKLPVDGPRTTNPPLDVAMSSSGGIVAVFGSNGGSGGTACNYPALSRSKDGAAWKTCGPGKAENGDFSPQPATLHVIEAENDKAYVLWQEPSENKYGQGILLWHER
jgi:hypothetical protein